MSFQNLIFLLLFLPISLLLTYIVPLKLKNFTVLLESIVFYFAAAPSFLPLIICLFIVSYLAALLIEKNKREKLDAKTSNRKISNAILVVYVVTNVTVLFAFKYNLYVSDFISHIMGEGFTDIDFLEIMPLGISYYIFKLISYVTDVHNDKIAAEKNVISLASYALFYSWILVGPIIRYTDVSEYFRNPRHAKREQLEEGTRQIVFGLAKKVILADTLGLLWLDVISDSGVSFKNASVALVWLGIIAFSLQLYLDFSGFSEIGTGIGLLYGIPCKKNFDYPYISNNITEFWKRWHISLSLWFRDYIYIPLGGSRVGFLRQILNLLIVWIVTGIWHGSTINYIIWGVYYFVLLTIEKIIYPKFSVIMKKIWHALTLVIVAFGWGIFSATGQYYTVNMYFSKLLFLSGSPIIEFSDLYFVQNYLVVLILSLLASSSVAVYLKEKLQNKNLFNTIVCCGLFILCILFIVQGTGQAALYANF